MCRDDGAANRWTGDCSLGWQPSAHRAAPPAHRFPSISHVLHAALAGALHTLFQPCCSVFLDVVPLSLSLSHLPLNFIFASCPLVAVFLPPPPPHPGGKQLSAKTEPNPQLFLPVLKRREKQSVSVFIPPCCAGLNPALKSTAQSHMP